MSLWVSSRYPGGQSCYSEGPGQTGEVSWQVLTKFSKYQCKFLQLDQNSPLHQHRLGADWLGSSFVEKARGSSWTMHGCSKDILGCISKSIAGRREVILPPLFNTFKTASGAAWPVLRVPSARKTLTNPSKSHRESLRWSGAEAHVVRGEAERVGLVQPGEGSGGFLTRFTAT